MPAENRNSDCPSLNWEEFFVSSNSEDLLPCLLGMYDSIAAAQKLRNSSLLDSNSKSVVNTTRADNTVDKMENDVNQKNGIVCGTDNDFCTNCQSPLQSPSVDISSEIPWCHFRDISCSTSPKCNNKYIVVRPCSPVSVTSLSSRSSVSSNGSSLDCSIDADNEESNPQGADDSSNLPIESFNSLVADSNRMKTARTLIPQIRNSYRTASQYSEDSGIYSNLIRSESLQERSWFYADGEDFNYTNRVILEILETELIYVNDLHQIIMGYLDEWKNDCNCTLSNEQIHDLFSNIEEIYNFNRCFLWELEQCGLDPVKIARCFVENNSNFSIYADYCTHYPRSISILTELMRQEKTAHIFRERQIRLHHTLPLGSYLLKPVQRILKYHLLLQNMVKHTPPDTVGYSDITVALSTMTGIAHHINTMKRRHEHAVRVQEVQSLLIGWQGLDLTTFGELYAEGSFRISGAKAFRHIFLFEHMLLVTKKKEAGILNYKTHILCSNLMLVECIPKEPLSFQIIPFDNPRLQFSVHARSLEEKRYWTLELKRVILENYNVHIPSHARQLVMELGQIQHSENISMEKISSPKRQHSTPEYLERRKPDREKKITIKSRLLPLFRKLDSLQNHKMRSKLKKNQFLSEGSIFSDTSANSDEFYSNDNELQNLSKTTEDLSQTCKGMTRTLEELSKSSTTSLSSSNRITEHMSTNADEENEEHTSYQQKEKLIEEIIGQLLIASQKFQKAIRDHELSVRTKQNIKNSDCQNGNPSPDVKSNFEDYETDDESFSNQGSLSSSSSCMRDILKYTKESTDAIKLVIGKDGSVLNTSSESLSPSLNVLIPTPPNVWLKQQAEHLATPQKKADSLPRTFQINTEDEWRVNRPKTIASDKPTQINAIKRFENDEIVGNHNFLTLRKKEIVSSVASFNTTNVHPECKFYRTSVARMTFKRMVHTIGTKLMIKRGKNERFYKIEHDIYRTGGKRMLKSDMDFENNSIKKVPVYMQGSSDLGARIANASEISDYADPKVLFPTITPSKKAAALLGIRAYSSLSQSKINVSKSLDGIGKDVNSEEPIYSVPALLSTEVEMYCKSEDSDGSADSFYERQFEQVETEFENAVHETSILNDTAEINEIRDVSESFRRYSRVSVNISVHKLIKIPPPIPIKPNTLRNAHCRFVRNSRTKTLINAKKFSTNHTTEFSIPTRGWVKQVVDKFQSCN